MEPTAHQTGLVQKAKRDGFDPLNTYIAWAVDRENMAQTAEIFEFLKSKAAYPDEIHQNRFEGKVMGWSRLSLSDADKSVTEGHTGIKKPLKRNKPVEGDPVASGIRTHGFDQSLYANGLDAAIKQKRAVTWTKQEGAVKDLQMINQPK